MQTPTQMILSNCRVFLNNKNNEMALFESAASKNNLSNKKLNELRSKISNVDAFQISKVMSVALANQSFLSSLIEHSNASYSAIPDFVYKMACRNLASQIKTDRELKSKILRMRSKEKIKETQELILDMDAFSLSQIMAIAFLKPSNEIVLDIVNEQNNLIDEF